MSRKKTHEEFVGEVEEKYGNRYTILEEYVNNHIKILIKCNKCGHEWKIEPNSLLQGHGCPKCYGNVKKTHEEVIKILEEYNLTIYKGEIYKNNQTPIKCIDSEGYMVYPTVSSLQRGRGVSRFHISNPSTIENIKHYIKYYADNVEGIELVSDKYKSANSKLTFNCKKHGEFKMTWNNFYRGQRCPKCGDENTGNKLRKTQEEFVKEVKEAHKDRYTILEEYVNDRTKLLVRCNKCGHEWKITPSHLLQDRGCPKCAGNIKKTHEEVIEILKKYNLTMCEGEVYINYSTPIKCIDNEGYIVYPIISVLQRGYLPSRFGNGNQSTIENIKHYIKYYANNVDGIELISNEYKGNNSKLTFNCKKHGEFKMTWGKFYSGQRCPKCAGNIKKTHEEFIREVEDKYGNRYTILEEYIDAKTKLKVRCNTCGYKWKTTPNRLLRGHGCPKCNQSKGENRVEIWLKENNIKYETQYVFNDCKYKSLLKFDFYLPDYNICIEYDGEQHKKPVRFNGISEKEAIKIFKENQKRDKIKDDYCKTHNIPLLRIPYTEFDNIETILENFLKDINTNNNNLLTKSENVI